MCRRNVLIGGLLVVVLLGGTAAHAGSDVFSVNFWANNGIPDPPTNGTIEANQSPGVETWETTGWENIRVPWNPGGPQEAVTITSVLGQTATFTLEEARNGGGGQTVEGARILPDGDDNGDLMDKSAWGTLEDAANPDKIFSMTVSDIPFDVYDVIIYLGYKPGHGGDGTGKIVFNGMASAFITESFTDTFIEYVDSDTPCNYIVFEGVKGPSFTVQVWGNGFNHIGPCGFQFRQAAPALAADPDPSDEARQQMCLGMWS